VLRTPVNEWLDPMKEAPSFEGAFLVSATPPIGKAPGRGTGEGGGVLTGRKKICVVTTPCPTRYLYNSAQSCEKKAITNYYRSQRMQTKR